MSLRIGIDIGSTTVKVVVLDEQNKLLFRSYERHYSKTRERACETLRSISDMLAGRQVKMVITGSAGLGVANASGIDFVQEVYATAAAVNTYIPGTDAVIELGGEDAKIIFFGGALEERMNGSCAGGTGAFIDQMATLMNVSVDELDALSLKHEKIYPIASRCGVFAKSDIQPILNQGGRKEDVAASIFQAVVDQTVAGLTQGRELKGKIVFLGGPLHFLMGLRERFVETLKLDEEHAIFPEDGDCFAGIGAAMCAADYPELLFDDALDRLEKAVDATQSINTLPPLFTSREEYDAFVARHNQNHLPERTFPPIPAWPTSASTPAPPPRRWCSSPRTAASSFPITAPTKETRAYRARAAAENLRVVRQAHSDRRQRRHRLRRGPDQKRLPLRSGTGGDRGPSGCRPVF